MENKLIDPYGLLGVDSRASLSELKKNYYNLALICHPDKGGNDKDMNVLSLAYNYIKEHFENVKETTYEKLEEAMENPNSVNRDKYEKIRKLNLHKMEPIPVCKIPK